MIYLSVSLLLCGLTSNLISNVWSILIRIILASKDVQFFRLLGRQHLLLGQIETILNTFCANLHMHSADVDLVFLLSYGFISGLALS